MHYIGNAGKYPAPGLEHTCHVFDRPERIVQMLQNVSEDDVVKFLIKRQILIFDIACPCISKYGRYLNSRFTDLKPEHICVRKSIFDLKKSGATITSDLKHI